MNTDKFERATEISRDISELKVLMSVMNDGFTNLRLQKNSCMLSSSITNFPSWIDEKYMQLIKNDVKDKLKELEKEFEEL